MRTLEALYAGRLDFEQLCQDLDEFEPLPSHATNVLDDDALTEDDQGLTSPDELLLAGLVSPV